MSQSNKCSVCEKRNTASEERKRKKEEKRKADELDQESAVVRKSQSERKKLLKCAQQVGKRWAEFPQSQRVRGEEAKTIEDLSQLTAQLQDLRHESNPGGPDQALSKLKRLEALVEECKSISIEQLATAEAGQLASIAQSVEKVTGGISAVREIIESMASSD